MNQRKILSDHKKKGKKIIPPLMTLPNFKENSYVDLIIPEIIWMAILNENLGIQRGTELSVDLVKSASSNSSGSFHFSFISSYELLNQDEKNRIIEDLKDHGSLDLLRSTLTNFLSIYPNCPLNFLLENKNPSQNFSTQDVKGVLQLLYDKMGRTSTFAMGNVIYHMFCLEKLVVVDKSAMSELPKLVDYPKTEISKLIASSIRASIHAIFNETFHHSKNHWNSYFWNRGHELEPLTI
ncbi:MAG: hypothetical protein ACJA08_002569 [Cyclobacteriaceae bacterium]